MYTCTKKGVNLETLLKETSVDRDIQRAATLKFVNQGDKEYKKWEGHIQRLELVVYSLSLLYAAQKMGINAATLSKDPLPVQGATVCS